MARRVSANRMELMKLKNELTIAKRGHSLLKDKRDGLMQQFLALIDETLSKREEVDALLGKATDAMAFASAVIEPEVLLQAMKLSTEALELDVSTENVMSVSTPVFNLTEDITGEDEDKLAKEDFLEYSLVQTTGDIDIAFSALSEAVVPMLRLATLEKKVQILANELETTRRRVNSLEHVLIPEINETIREVEMKMEENERQNIVRLMKVKEMILEEDLKKKELKRQQSARR